MSLGDKDNMDTISKETSEREKQVFAAGFMYLLAFSIEKTERSLRLVGVVAPAPQRAIPQIFNRQYSIPACPGWVYSIPSIFITTRVISSSDLCPRVNKLSSL